MKRSKWIPVGLVVGMSMSSLAAAQLGAAPVETRGSPDVVYIPTPPTVVEAMLDMAQVKRGDVVYDLGCGDGRIVIQAAKRHGARGIGIDIDAYRIRQARENARDAGVSERVEFRQQDLFETDFRDADVVTLYLLDRLNLRLRPRLLEQLRPGARIVSHAFGMGEWKPDAEATVNGAKVFLWVVPEEVPPELKRAPPQ